MDPAGHMNIINYKMEGSGSVGLESNKVKIATDLANKQVRKIHDTYIQMR